MTPHLVAALPEHPTVRGCFGMGRGQSRWSGACESPRSVQMPLALRIIGSYLRA